MGLKFLMWIKKNTYEKGVISSMLFGGVILVILLWIYEILILLYSNVIGIESLALFWLPAFPALLFKIKSKNMALITATFFWFIMGCLINLILYSLSKTKK